MPGACLLRGISVFVFLGLTLPLDAERPAGDVRALARQSLARIAGETRLRGLRERVEILRDRWGVTHIYARGTDDLFFAQGYAAAQDRLWQMEMWRRAREGRLAEVAGERAFERDRQMRLLGYRGPMDEREWTSYHPDGKRIFSAFAAGVNAFVAESAGHLPVEFRLTGIEPRPWSAETLVLRSPSFGDAAGEVQLALDVARLGVEEANRRRAPDPWDDLKVPDGLDVGAIGREILEAMRLPAGPPPRPDLVEPYRTWLATGADPPAQVREPGSNNWVVGGRLSATGKPVVANDPHREVTNPSLRTIVHLSAPGWNVIGAVEAPFVGVALGHNDRLAWGLTIVGTDQHDVYVEEVNPAKPNEVKYNGAWEPLEIVKEEIAVRGEASRTVELKFSRHGPIFFEDRARNRAYALRSALAEPGTAAYLGGLRLAQARDCRDFLAAAMYWKAPSENLICGDVDGNIAWQASALTPRRRGWLGRLPVPGTGSFEWDGFRSDLPRELNPARGYIATANHNIHPKGFWPPVMFKSSANLPFDRITRIEAVLGRARSMTLEDHRKLQHDAYSLRAAADTELFRGWSGATPEVENARRMIAGWDAVLGKESAAAAIYMTWRGTVDPKALDTRAPIAERLPHVAPGLAKAVEKLTRDMGPEWKEWRYGRMHAQRFPHPLASAFDLPAVERSGGGGTLAADGATYREILDVGDWERSVATNTPGQSGQPESSFYGNLLPLWARAEYFPLVFARARVERETAHKLVLMPAPR